MRGMKGILMTAVVVLAVMAVANRIPQIRNLVNG